MSIIIFILILSFLVIIHETGHFLIARRAGIKVEEFGIGYPPRALTLRKDKSGTEYTLNWLPFGGFVRLYGEDGPGGDEAATQPGAFYQKPVISRLLVVAAGAIVNFIFGALAFGAIYTSIGIPTHYPYVKIDEVAPGTPAFTAGIKKGDSFSAVVAKGQTIPIKSVDDFVKTVGNYRGQTVGLVRAGTTEQVKVLVRAVADTPSGQGAMGVVVTDFGFEHFPIWQMPFRGIAYGVKTAVEFGVILLQALGSMVGRLFQGQVPQDVAGPVGIAYIANKSGILTGGWMDVFNFAAILSINLSIVNLLPIPALDGGRAVFLLIEGITGKRVKPEIERNVNTIGFAALVLLLILISVKDVRMVAGDKGVQTFFRGLTGK